MIAIVDYQMGNLRSVQKAFECVGHPAVITDRRADLSNADRIVLPGVGAFADAMAELQRRDLVQPLKQMVQSGKPFLGICLGLQLLFDFGHEGGQHEGLGVVPGQVRKFELGPEFKVPHMGWNQIEPQCSSPILNGIEPGAYVYFVHSYYVDPVQSACIALTSHHGHSFCAAIARDNLFATQFHPEKSQSVGLRMIQNFAEWQV